jgi:hypothetical protein
MKNQKGIQLNQAFGAVLAVVLIGVLVIVAIFLFVTLGNSMPDTPAIPNLNEATTLVTAGTYLANATACGVSGFSISSVRNTTDGLLVQPANYTVTSTGLLKNGSRVEYDAVTVNYTYRYKGSSCVASQSMVTNFSQFPTLVGLVGTIVFLGLVIGVLVASFVFGGKSTV